MSKLALESAQTWEILTLETIRSSKSTETWVSLDPYHDEKVPKVTSLRSFKNLWDLGFWSFDNLRDLGFWKTYEAGEW